MSSLHFSFSSSRPSPPRSINGSSHSSTVTLTTTPLQLLSISVDLCKRVL
uniref:Uncharacterized protein n=1 Tax=Rhizophora mucronata TaxID=61149 RepID=A0A2P2NB88_RHIMU